MPAGTNQTLCRPFPGKATTKTVNKANNTTPSHGAPMVTPACPTSPTSEGHVPSPIRIAAPSTSPISRVPYTSEAITASSKDVNGFKTASYSTYQPA